MPELVDDLEDYEAYKNETNYGSEVERAQYNLKELIRPKIDLKFHNDNEDYIEVPEGTISLKQYLKSWFVKEDNST